MNHREDCQGNCFLGAVELPGAPQHLQENRSRKFHLRRFANMIAGHYGVPVYLCGSALRADNPEPRDWDLRLELPEEDFLARYGDPQQWEREGNTGDWTQIRWRWADDCVKQTKLAWKHCQLNVDLQIEPLGYARREHAGKPQLRLDTREEWAAAELPAPTGSTESGAASPGNPP